MSRSIHVLLSVRSSPPHFRLQSFTRRSRDVSSLFVAPHLICGFKCWGFVVVYFCIQISDVGLRVRPSSVSFHKFFTPAPSINNAGWRTWIVSSVYLWVHLNCVIRISVGALELRSRQWSCPWRCLAVSSSAQVVSTKPRTNTHVTKQQQTTNSWVLRTRRSFFPHCQ